MAEALGSILFSMISSVADRISGQELKDFFKGNKINEGDLHTLKMLLLSTAKVLNDAEEKQFSDPMVKEWIDRLKDSAYDADDLIDEVVNKVRYGARDLASSLNPFSERLPSRFADIVENLRSSDDAKDILGLKEGMTNNFRSIASATTSLVDESQVYGRNDDIKKVVDFLLYDNCNEEGLPLVAITGMRGIGKTTLAQVLYNNPPVISHFDCRLWTSVSPSATVLEITKQVLESLTSCQPNIVEFDGLQIQLKHKLKGKKFLIVFDGFENESYLDWIILQRPFLPSIPGSKIIVTTRSKRVARAIRADLTHFLPFLSHEETWKLFSSFAFNSQNPKEHNPILIQIGKKIVRRCGGLPQAAITLGSFLHSNEDSEEWEKVCNSTLGDLSKGKNIFFELISSYTRLSSSLKKCFSFCSIFPIGYDIGKRDLIDLWMAEGLLPHSTTIKRMEDIGDEIFEDLLTNGFFYPNPPSYLMHNLIHELAEFVAGQFCYRLDDCDPSTLTVSRVRHVSFLQGVDDMCSSKLEIFKSFKKLRTLIPFKFLSPPEEEKENFRVFTSLFPKGKCLRVLSLANYPIEELPTTVGQLTHLRYLNLSRTMVTSLPDSICRLYNLQTLLLVECFYLNLLPAKTSKLVNLRQLDLSKSAVRKMPTNFGQLKSLQLLPYVVVGEDGKSNFSELGELSELRGSLLIVNLQNVLNAEEASNANLKAKIHLLDLEFKWTNTTHNQESEKNILEALEPPPNLRRLLVHNFGGDTFPCWLGKSAISTLVITSCSSLISIPLEGMPNTLKSLTISHCKILQVFQNEMLRENFHYYHMLTKLELQYCDSLNFIQLSLFPKLEELLIEGCSSLASILSETNSLPYLQTVELKGCSILAEFPFSSIPLDTSLFQLGVKKCPLLKMECERETGKYWSVVSKLPSAVIED